MISHYQVDARSNMRLLRVTRNETSLKRKIIFQFFTMAEADWHIRDLLLFYVSKCRGELLSASGDPMKAETVFESVKRVREYMLLMSCMVGAITPAEIVALNKLEQIRLVAENESAQMLRIGEDMTMLRMWLKTALDVQWNVLDSVKLLKHGHLSNSSAFPEMTLDLLTSVNKPFVVPSEIPSNWEFIQKSLHASISNQFLQAKSTFPFVPSRVCISFDPVDGSCCLSSADEFRVVGIFDNKRWTILEAQILKDTAPQCRQILQAINATSVAEICVSALRMATAQRLMNMQKEATLLLSTQNDWSSLYSLTKSKSGLGNSFTVALFKNYPISVEFAMNPDNGDLIVSHEHDFANMTFFNIIQTIEIKVQKQILSEKNFDPQILASVTITGSILLQLPILNLSLSANLNSDLLNTHHQSLSFIAKMHAFVTTQDGWTLCASPTQTPHVEMSMDWQENLARINPDKFFSVTFINRENEFVSYCFDINFVTQNALDMTY